MCMCTYESARDILVLIALSNKEAAQTIHKLTKSLTARSACIYTTITKLSCAGPNVFTGSAKIVVLFCIIQLFNIFD